MGHYCIMDSEFQFEKIKSSGDGWWWCACTTMWLYLLSLNCKVKFHTIYTCVHTHTHTHTHRLWAFRLSRFDSRGIRHICQSVNPLSRLPSFVVDVSPCVFSDLEGHRFVYFIFESLSYSLQQLVSNLWVTVIILSQKFYIHF